MRSWLVLASVAFVFLFFGCGFALPIPPSIVRVEEVAEGIRVSWEYAQGEFVFNVYRGNSFKDANIIATVKEKQFIDRGVAQNVEYFYFVTAVDEAGEESPPQKPLVGTLLFSVSLVEPKKLTASYGGEVQFVFEVKSSRLDELQDFRAILLNEQLGLRQQFEFDPASKRFSLSIRLPEEQQFETLSPTYSYTIWATASLDGQQLFDFKNLEISLIPSTNLEKLLAGLLPVLFLLFIAAVALIAWKSIISKRRVRESLQLELLGVLKERAIWKHEAFNMRITEQQFREKDAELQGRGLVIEEKLGLRKAGEKPKINPFEGYKPWEMEEIYALVQAIKKPKKGMDKDHFRAWLVGRGKNERIAKRVAELVFEKK